MVDNIIYLSCNPSTQKRDIELFQKYGYKVVSLKGYDMFPHTWHIESLAVLVRDENCIQKRKKSEIIKTTEKTLFFDFLGY